MTARTVTDALAQIIEEVDEYAASYKNPGVGLGAYEACFNVRKIAKKQLKALSTLSPAPPVATAEVTMGVGTGDTGLFVHGSYESIKALQAKIFELEHLRRKHHKEPEKLLPPLSLSDALDMTSILTDQINEAISLDDPCVYKYSLAEFRLRLGDILKRLEK